MVNNGHWETHYDEAHMNRKLLEGNILEHGPFIQECGAFLGKGFKALEVGSGTGCLGWPLAQAGVRVTSLDNNARIIEMCKDNTALLGADIEFVEGDAFNLPFEDNSFDLVFSQGFYEHYSDDEIQDLLHEQKRVAPVVGISVPVEGATGGMYGDERLLPAGDWADKFKFEEIKAAVIYGHVPSLCLIIVRKAGG